MRPKDVLSMLILVGFAKVGVLVTFSAVAPICAKNRSLIRIRLITFMFKAFEPGPWMTSWPREPITPGSGFTSSGDPLAFALSLSVELGFRAVGREATYGSVICVRPGK